MFKAILFVSRIFQLVFLYVLLISVAVSHANADDDVLDFLPGILASFGECELRNVSRLRPNCTVIVSANQNLGGDTIYLPSNVDLLIKAVALAMAPWYLMVEPSTVSF